MQLVTFPLEDFQWSIALLITCHACLEVMQHRGIRGFSTGQRNRPRRSVPCLVRHCFRGHRAFGLCTSSWTLWETRAWIILATPVYTMLWMETEHQLHAEVQTRALVLASVWARCQQLRLILQGRSLSQCTGLLPQTSHCCISQPCFCNRSHSGHVMVAGIPCQRQ